MTHELGFGQSELPWGDTYMKLPRVTAVLDTIAALRVKRVRGVLSWGMVEPSLNKFNWANADRFVALALDRGIKPLLTCSTPRPTTYSKSSANYANFVQNVANRYGVTGFTYNGKVYPPMNPVEIEIFNEPNLATFWSPVRPANYTEFLKASYAAIKTVAPGSNSIVVSAGIAGAVGSDNLGWVMDSVTYAKGMIAAGAVGNFDAFGWHPYSSDETFNEIEPDINGNTFIKEQAVRDLLDANGAHDIDIWWTEWGFGTSLISFEQAAQWDAEQWAIYQTLDRRGPAYRYDLSDSANKPTAKNSSYGVTDYFLVPKPSYFFFDSVSEPVSLGALSSVGSLTTTVVGLKKPQLSSVGELSVKIYGRAAAHLASTGTLGVEVIHGGHLPELSSEGTLAVTVTQQRLYSHDFNFDGNTKPTTVFTDFGPFDYFVLSGKAINHNPTSNGVYYDGGIYHLQTLTPDQFIEVEQAEDKSFADRSIMCMGRVAADGSQAIFATMRWGGTDSSQILMWDGTAITEMASGTAKLASGGDKLGLRIDGDVYTVTKNGADTDCQWDDDTHMYAGRANKGVGFGFQHKRVGGVNYGAPALDKWWGRDLRGVVAAALPSRTGALSATGTLSVAVTGARNGNFAGAGTLSAKAAGTKTPHLSSTGTLTCAVATSLHGNMSGTGTLSAKAAAAKKGLLSSTGTLTAIAVGARNGHFAGGGTLTAVVAGAKVGNLSSTGTLHATAAGAKKPQLSSTGTLSVSVALPAVTAISCVGAEWTGNGPSTGNTLAALGTHAAGDQLVGFAYNSNFSTLPAPPSPPWTTPTNGTKTATGGARVAGKIAASSSEVSDNWGTAPNDLIVAAIRGGIIGAVANGSGSTGTITIPALTLQVTDGTSKVLTFIAISNASGGNLAGQPAGMDVLIDVETGNDNDCAAYITHAGVTSFAGGTVNHTVGAPWIAFSVEIKKSP